jgi:2-polyprenyl-6-methoxyphenol hydroxylase-like FAD-dependent oxidoreductase
MARIIMIGGGVVGLTGAQLLARDGHDITVLERDPAPPPDPGAAWSEWERRGVNQFRMLHYFQPGYRAIVEKHAPEIVQEMDAAGAYHFNPFKIFPDFVTGGWRDGDEAFEAVTARRPVGEAAIARAAAANGNIDVRRGVTVAGLVADGEKLAGVPHLVGVRTEDGEELRADLVLDVAGRRSSLPKMLTDAGARAPIEELEDCGFIYYGRHFKSPDGSLPAMIGPLLQAFGSISVLTLPSDNGTWGVGVVTSAKDKEMRAVRDVAAWERVMKSLPAVAHWIDGEPIDDGVAVMAGIPDRHRAFVVDGDPVATGVLALGDSWAATNPSVGRGITIGTIQALALRDFLRDAPTDPVELARGWHDATLASVEPWYRGTLAFDSGRLEEIHSILENREFAPAPDYEMVMALQAAGTKDHDLFRSLFEVVGVQRLPEVIFAENPDLFTRAIELGGNWRDERPPAPSREELVAALAA